MRFKPYSVEPPRTATWLVSLFTLAGESESILGDLLEEFSYLASNSGAAFARRWYWRQALKTIAHLIPTAFRVAPWSTTAGVIGGFLTRGLLARLPGRTIFAVIERYQVYQYHFKTYVFFASTGIDIGIFITFLFAGCIVALVAKGTEMAAAMVLSLIFGAMAVVGLVGFQYVVGRTGYLESLWMLKWYFADSLAIVIGAAIVRTRRSNARTLPLNP
jgi:hypothetical protein